MAEQTLAGGGGLFGSWQTGIICALSAIDFRNASMVQQQGTQPGEPTRGKYNDKLADAMAVLALIVISVAAATVWVAGQ